MTEKIGYTLNWHIGEEERRHPEFANQLSSLLAQVAHAAKILAREFGRSALVGKLGLTGGNNPTGDAQKILDVFSNEIIIEAFAKTGLVAAIVSEELGEVKFLTCQTDARHKDGKLRLLYECAPLAFVVEQSGGRASTGTRRILNIQAESIHQRAPLVIGSAEEVSLYEKFFMNGNP